MREALNDQRLIITETDHARLRDFIQHHRIAASASPWALLRLEQQLDNAKIVPSRMVPDDVVTMRSRVRVRTDDAVKPDEYTLEYPHTADDHAAGISILTPLATAILGERAGTSVAWNLAAGMRRYAIERIAYQPEASGHLDQ